MNAGASQADTAILVIDIVKEGARRGIGVFRTKTFPQFYDWSEDISWEIGAEDGIELLLNAFPGVGLGDGAVLVVGVDSGLGDGGNSITEGLRSLAVWEDGFERNEELIFVHGFISVGSNGGENRLKKLSEL